MKLYFMRQKAIDYLKANMKTIYMNYYRYNTNEWLFDLFDYDPFEAFIEVPDFELAPISNQKGEVEFNNCKILYSNLRKISESQASDERLWAGLCNGVFYSYVRERWGYGTLRQTNPTKDAGSILSRFFFSGGGRNGMFRSTLAKCWWVAQIAYVENDPNHWKQLDGIGFEDFVTKVSDIFRNNNFVFNPDILDGICKGLKFFRDKGIKITTREHLRPTLQYLNALGGGLLLDELSPEEISKIIIESITRLMKGDETDFFIDEMNADSLADELEEYDSSAPEVSFDYQEEQEFLEQEIEDIDPNQLLGVPTVVQHGCTVIVLNKDSNKEILYSIPVINGGRELYGIEKRVLGKKVGDSVKVRTTEFEIISIRW